MFTFNLKSNRHLFCLAGMGILLSTIFIGICIIAILNDRLDAADHERGALDKYQITSELKWVDEVELRCQSFGNAQTYTKMTYMDLYKDLGGIRQCAGRFSYNGDFSPAAKTLERMGFVKFAAYPPYAGAHVEIWRKPPKKAEPEK